MKKKTPCNGLIFVLLFLWQLPQNLVALLVMPFLGPLSFVDYRHYCIGLAGTRFPKQASGISLGSFAFFHPDYAHDAHTIRHEMDGHTVASTSLPGAEKKEMLLVVVVIP